MKGKHMSKLQKFIDKIDNLLSKEPKPTQEQMNHIAKIAKEKEEASRKHEPYIAIINMDVDYEHLDGEVLNLNGMMYSLLNC